MNIESFWNENVKMYDLSQKLSHLTPPWPTYEPLQVKFFKRLAPNGANGMLATHSNHVGTHLDGPLHFDTAGRDLASIELEKLVGPAAIADLSDQAEDFGIYTPQDIMDRVEVKKGDILIIKTGYCKYAWDEPEADERRYMLRHPGPSLDFMEWAHKMELKWIGVDCGSADHPMNTKIRDWEPQEAKACDAYMQEKYGKTLNEMYPWPEQYQAMHLQMFPQKYGEIIHAECMGGDLVDLTSRRMIVGVFPWRWEGGESSIARIVGFDDK
jgi:arylformamidase